MDSKNRQGQAGLEQCVKGVEHRTLDAAVGSLSDALSAAQAPAIGFTPKEANFYLELENLYYQNNACDGPLKSSPCLCEWGRQRRMSWYENQAHIPAWFSLASPLGHRHDDVNVFAKPAAIMKANKDGYRDELSPNLRQMLLARPVLDHAPAQCASGPDVDPG